MLFVAFEMLGLLINTLTADDKYSRCNRENFPQQFQKQLSQSLSISKIIVSEGGGYLNVEKVLFQANLC